MTLKYPVIVSPKLDGFRCLVAEGRTFTSSMKEMPNRFVQQELAHPMFDYLDGELIVGDPTHPDVFYHTSGPLRRVDGEPDFKFYAFDDFLYPNDPFTVRWSRICGRNHQRLVILEQVLCQNSDQVFQYERKCLADGYEGVMIRLPNGVYKSGRCTYNEMNMFKRKPFVLCIAEIKGFVEAMTNLNEQEEDELGLMKRSKRKENLEPKGTLGSLLLRCDLWESTFTARLGKGYTAMDNQILWDSREHFYGMKVVVKYQKHGSKDAPRIPSVIQVGGEIDERISGSVV